MERSVIVSLGSYFPKRVLSNNDLEGFLETNDEWIMRRTGIRERRICASHETNQTMAFEAAKDAIARLPSESKIEHIVVATNTNHQKFPSTAMYVEDSIRAWRPDALAHNVAGADIEAGCAGINYALMAADLMIRAGQYSCILVIGTDHLSSVTDYRDRQTAVLFGDGAGVYILEQAKGKNGGFLGHDMSGDGSGQNLLLCEENSQYVGLEEAMRAARENEVPVAMEGPVLRMDGKAVYEYVVNYLDGLVGGFKENKKLNPEGLSFDDVRFVIPHQANIRMLQGLGRRHPGFFEKCMVSIERYGNTSTSSQIIPLCECLEDRAKPGDVMLMVGYGAGLTSGANLYRVP